jgi:pimeloyl-ACP methyl ester carboxylesterase
LAQLRRVETGAVSESSSGPAGNASKEAPLDIGAWIDWTLGLGFERVVLLGHSFGGPKVVYYQAQRQDSRVVGIVCASPGSAHAGQPRFAVSPEVYDLAERMVAEGRGQDLLPWGTYGGVSNGAISAQTCLDWAPAHRAQGDVFGVFTEQPAIGRIRCPIFAFYGTDEADEGGPAELERIRRGATAANVETRMFAGADHLYTGHESEIADAVAAWLGTLG